MAKTPKYIEHDMFRMPMGFSTEAYRSALNYSATAEDIFVCSYPKCGTTWLQNIVYLILNGGVPLGPDMRLPTVFPHLEEVGLQVCEKLPTPRLIKTHLPFFVTPWHLEARYFYIARNPFDCVVSFFHHTCGFPQHYDFLDGEFNEFFECFISGKVDFGDYFDNLIPWYNQRDKSNVFFITYESMISDSRAAIKKIGKFLETDATKLDKTIDQVVRYSSFESMQKYQTRWASPRIDAVSPFIRKGVVGDWKNYFSHDQAYRLLDKFLNKIQGTSIDKLWPDIVASVRHYS
ncbi:MAG: sulfotransferase [Rhodospirillaceae bacterium]|nr:sulfotransferase [Rhodospirillaceae bacterium]|tara:strand:- start:1041 stop:1910 length:870 start_codon:yes stop_codon:yes gene_type:complete